MRSPAIDGKTALEQRLRAKQQLPDTAPESELPDVLESFLAHLRLLVGVPFESLVADARLLPDESARFFFIDRSWTDRLVDGALAVGKIGTREQAHHQAHHAPVMQTLDATERNVRDLQRGRIDLAAAKAAAASTPPVPAGPVTGFLLRSAAVAGWPDMDVRAFDTILQEPVDATLAAAHQLRTLRLERLSPSVLLALFDGVPQLVWCEEPHHGVQFGVQAASGGRFVVARRRPTGEPESPAKPPVAAPMRASQPRVLSIAGLRRELWKAAASDPQMVPQVGSGALAIELLDLPWRQRFEGAGGPDRGRTPAGPVRVSVVGQVADTATVAAMRDLTS